VARAELDAEDALLLELASCKTTSTVRLKQVRTRVLKRAMRRSHPMDYLGKYTGPGKNQLLKDFKKLQQLAVPKKAEKIREENCEN
jgi:hypothetical protein